jgi:hypothetical protein
VISLLVRPGQWNEPLPGIWVHVTALDDPLLVAREHRLDVHRDDRGDVWITVSGNNVGVRVQSAPPNTADHDGGPL